MQFTADEYLRAGVERMRQARAIHNSGEGYALAMYCGGLAVECLLRAFRWKEDRSFEGRHDLLDLLKGSGLLGTSEDQLRRRGFSEVEVQAQATAFRAAVSEVVLLWHNNLRFASEGSLRAHLRRIGRLQGVKGDALKKNARDLLDAAQTVINRGVALWNLRKK
ncbi:MAG: hypothetical protein HYS13_05955 [Planctomycetia bacterium]|nr:hypothetical protein [Planctomycetia bacterium]